MMDHEKLFQITDSLNGEYIGMWEDVCNLESPTADKAGVDAVGEYFASRAREKGWRVEVYPQEKAGNPVCIVMNPEAAGPAVVLSGHLDTVHPKGMFGTPAVRREGDRILGPGVGDCKGGAVAGMMAMDALSRAGYDGGPVMLILQTDEENSSRVSGKATIRWICERAKDAAAFLNLEPYGKGKACLSRKGIITFRFRVHGVKAHSSICATKGANAIAEAARLILEIEKIKDPEGLTCCCSVIQGGTVPNTVPDLCEFLVNVRFADAAQDARIRDFMRKLADTPHISGCSIELDIVSQRLAMERSERNEALLAKMNRCFARCGLPELQAVFSAGGSDAAEVTAAGIPCVDSIGVEGGGYHSEREWALIPSLADCAKRIVAFLAGEGE